jgi:hypothetical protein
MLTLKLEFEKLRNEIYLFLYNQDNPFIYIYIYIGAKIGGGWQDPAPARKKKF